MCSFTNVVTCPTTPQGQLVGVDEELDPREAILRHATASSDPRYLAYTNAYAKTQPEAMYDDLDKDLDKSSEDEDDNAAK